MNVVILGINGSMGKYIHQVLEKREGITVLGGIDRDKSFSCREVKSLKEFENVDILIDFSSREAFPILIEALKSKIKVISGTTGYSINEIETLRKTSKDEATSIIWTPNFAKGASYMYKIIKSLNKSFELNDLVEIHKKTKKDTPSGTALEYSKLLGIKEDFIQSVRIKDAIATHEVTFSDIGEKIIIKHEVSSKNAFIVSFLTALNSIIKNEYLNVIGLNEFFRLIE